MSDNLKQYNQPTGRKLKIVAVCVGVLLLFSVVGNILFFVNTYKPKPLGWQYEIAITDVTSNIEQLEPDSNGNPTYKVTISANIKNLGNKIISGFINFACGTGVVLKVTDLDKNNNIYATGFSQITDNSNSSMINFNNIIFVSAEIYRLAN